MSQRMLILGLVTVIFITQTSGAEPLNPYETPGDAPTPGKIDALVTTQLKREGIRPARVCSDEVFVRRAHLDVIGTLPTADEVKEFLADHNPGKRSVLIDRLLQRPEFADYWSLKWCDLLRVKSEFPINLWPNAVQAYYRWVHACIKSDVPYDRFVRELLTASGSNFRDPPVNFYRAMRDRDPATIAATVALTVMAARNVNGIRICQMLPELAKQADKYAIIRGMTHGINAHETATYLVQTGRMPGGAISYPAAGAVVSYFKGYRSGHKGMIPPYIVLTESQGRFSEAGFLGQRHKPFATGGNPAQTPFAVEGIVAPGITEQQQRQRREWLDQLNTLRRAAPNTPAMKAHARSEDEAYDMILGGGAKVFDLSTEKDELRERYGMNKFGQSCLVARRLVEQGVPYVTINYDGWDTHKNHFQSMRTQLPELDKGMASLLQDLADRGLLDSTIVWWSGEFGRTPKIQWEAPYNGGRGHYGTAFSALLAGGGFRGGRVVGSTDARGETVKERPTSPADLIASIYDRLGIDTNAKLPLPDGSGIPLTSPGSDGSKTGGPLTEIM